MRLPPVGGSHTVAIMPMRRAALIFALAGAPLACSLFGDWSGFDVGSARDAGDAALDVTVPTDATPTDGQLDEGATDAPSDASIEAQSDQLSRSCAGTLQRRGRFGFDEVSPIDGWSQLNAPGSFFEITDAAVSPPNGVRFVAVGSGRVRFDLSLDAGAAQSIVWTRLRAKVRVEALSVAGSAAIFALRARDVRDAGVLSQATFRVQPDRRLRLCGNASLGVGVSCSDSIDGTHSLELATYRTVELLVERKPSGDEVYFAIEGKPIEGRPTPMFDASDAVPKVSLGYEVGLAGVISADAGEVSEVLLDDVDIELCTMP